MRKVLRIIKRFIVHDLMSKDWLLKGLSLVLAVVLWYFVGGENRIDKNVMIPIEIINLPRDLVISNQFKKEIEVSVSGPRSAILEMANRAITRQIDLSTATPGTMVIKNDNDHIPVPRGITVQRVQPQSIILSLDKLVQKKFPITARTVGRVAEGYHLQFLKMEPDVITITGPLTILSQFDELYTRPISLDGVKRSLQLQVPLELAPSIVDLIGETSVTADLGVGLETVTKTVDDMRVHAVVGGMKREVEPKTVKVVVNVPKLLLSKRFVPEELLTVLAMSRNEDGTLRVEAVPRADVELPIEVLSILPDRVALVGAGEQENPQLAEPDRQQEQMPDEGEAEEPVEQESGAPAEETGASGAPTILKHTKSKRKLVD